MRLVVSIFLSFAVAVLMGLASMPAQAAVRAAPHQGYGRVVFDWPDPVRYAVSVSGQTMTVVFSDPVQGNPADAQRALSGYIKGASLSADRKTATFTLTGDYQANSFTLGTSVVIDLRPADGTAPPSPAAQAPVSTPTPTPTPAAPSPSPSAAPASSNAPLIGVRTGTHDGYERLVFDWPRSVPYSVVSGSGSASVTFRRPGRINLDRLRNKLPPFLKSVDAATSPEALVVTLPVPRGGRVRHFLSGPKVVVDVMMSAEQAAQQAEAQDQPAASAEPASPQPQAPLTTRPGVLANGGQSGAGSAGGSATAGTAPAKGKAPTVQALEAAMRKGLQSPDKQGGAASEQPAVSTPGVTATGAVAAVNADEPDKNENVATDQTQPQGSASIASLSFPWSQATAAAVFRRGGYYWIVFDRHQDVDMKLLKKLGGDVVKHIEQIPSKSATIVRLVVDPGYNASVRREGLLWVVDFMRQPYHPAHPIEVTAQARSPVGPRLFMPVAEGGKAMVLLDPEVGDRFIVVPLIPLGNGISPNHSYPDADLPVTVQGILVEPHTDKVVVNSTRNGVDVTAQGGLTFSPNLNEIKTMATIGTQTNLTRVLDIGAWMRGGEDDFVKTKQMLQLAVAQAPKNRRDTARLDLARFFFANGYEAEALGILSVIGDDEPDLVNTAAFKALHGAASFMMGRWDEAVTDFSHPSLSDIEEAAFWRSLAQAQLGRPELQAQTIREYGGVIGTYPRAIKVPLAILAAQATVAAADDLATNNFLAAAKADDNTPHELAAMTYIEGKLAETAGNYDVAVETWGRLEDNSDRYYRARAVRDRLELLYRMEQLDRPNLIKGLERLRFAWRGGPFELSLLMRLGDLYTEEKEYGKALRVWQQAATYFQNQPGAELAMGRMRETFDKLYYDGLADTMTPLRAIALYDEFRELTPTGEKGDEMIRRLADRLVSVDLLQQAAALLERQVKYRLTGAEKAKVGARLGLVYLLDRQPGKAVEALLASKYEETPPPLERQRQQLLARALADLGRSNDAVTLLEGDDSRNADLLRAEIEWKIGNWNGAATALSHVVPKARPAMVLTDEEARLVLDWATALTLSQDERAVADIRGKYQAAMSRTTYNDAFDLITTPPTSGVIDYRTVSERIKQAEDFKSFLSAYRERLRDGGLSAIN